MRSIENSGVVKGFGEAARRHGEDANREKRNQAEPTHVNTHVC
jgi:hypothetical protein